MIIITTLFISNGIYIHTLPTSLDKNNTAQSSLSLPSPQGLQFLNTVFLPDIVASV